MHIRDQNDGLCATNAGNCTTNVRQFKEECQTFAKENLDISHVEVTATEALLREAEKRWKVIYIDVMLAAASSRWR
jgi:hypothetical protein